MLIVYRVVIIQFSNSTRKKHLKSSIGQFLLYATGLSCNLYPAGRFLLEYLPLDTSQQKTLTADYYSSMFLFYKRRGKNVLPKMGIFHFGLFFSLSVLSRNLLCFIFPTETKKSEK